eukprot:3842308-Rhodomonas_salina.1
MVISEKGVRRVRDSGGRRCSSSSQVTTCKHLQQTTDSTDNRQQIPWTMKHTYAQQTCKNDSEGARAYWRSRPLHSYSTCSPPCSSPVHAVSADMWAADTTRVASSSATWGTGSTGTWGTDCVTWGADNTGT